MKRFDLRQIMRDAHRTYKYVGKKQGKTFGEVLKSTWKLAKINMETGKTECYNAGRAGKTTGRKK